MLPVNAETFGISLAWVGVLLAANRIVRTFTYGAIAAFGERIGIKYLCILASITAVTSTAMYGLFQGWAPLLAARVVWGLSFAALLLVALGYSASDRARTGARVGVSRALEQIGPLIALTAGAWLAGIVGPRDVFLYLALVTCVSVLFAVMLPPSVARRPTSRESRPNILPKPDRLDILILWIGFAVDGVFTMTVTIMLAEHVVLELAMVWGGLLIAGRRLVEIVAAPALGYRRGPFRRPEATGRRLPPARRRLGFRGYRLALCRGARDHRRPGGAWNVDLGGRGALRAKRRASAAGPESDMAGHWGGGRSIDGGLFARPDEARDHPSRPRCDFPLQPVVARGLPRLAPADESVGH